MTRNLENITINIPELIVENLDELKKLGMITSRSEGVRIAVYDFIKKQFEYLKKLGFKQKIEGVKE